MKVVMKTGAVRRAKLQSNRHHQQTDTQLFTGRMPFLSPNQQCQSTKAILYVTNADLDASLTTELLGIQRWTVDGVVAQLRCGSQQRSRLGEQRVVLRLHQDRLDQHRVTSILVWLQYYNAIRRARLTIKPSTGTYLTFIIFSKPAPHAGSGDEEMDPLRFLAACRKRRLNQALSVLSVRLGFFWVCLLCC